MYEKTNSPAEIRTTYEAMRFISSMLPPYVKASETLPMIADIEGRIIPATIEARVPMERRTLSYVLRYLKNLKKLTGSASVSAISTSKELSFMLY